MTLKDILPPTLRKPIYAIYAIVGFVVGCIQVGFSAAEVGHPVWLTVAWAVYGFSGSAIGVVASANTDEEKYPH